MIFRRLNQVSQLIVLAIGALLVAPAFAAEDLVAKVGSVPITKYELQREQQKILPFNVSFHGGLPPEKLAEVREEAMGKLIERAYKVQYGMDEKISVDNSAVDKQFEAARAKFKSAKDFEKALGSEKSKGYRASIYRELLAKKSEEVVVDAKVKVTDAQVREYYEKNKSTFLRPKQFKASHILIRVDPASNKEEREALKKKADDLTARAKAGEDFYNLAYYNSDDRSKFVGGDLGYFHEGQTVKEFEDALLKMKPGEISGPVKTLHGYHIIKLVELNESRQLDFEEAKGKIRQSLEKKERESIYEKWMSELKKKYPLKRLGN